MEPKGILNNCLKESQRSSKGFLMEVPQGFKGILKGLPKESYSHPKRIPKGCLKGTPQEAKGIPQ